MISNKIILLTICLVVFEINLTLEITFCTQINAKSYLLTVKNGACYFSQWTSYSPGTTILQVGENEMLLSCKRKSQPAIISVLGWHKSCRDPSSFFHLDICLFHVTFQDQSIAIGPFSLTINMQEIERAALGFCLNHSELLGMGRTGQLPPHWCAMPGQNRKVKGPSRRGGTSFHIYLRRGVRNKEKN